MNKEHFRAFNAEFFEKHQGKLLWLLNNWFSRRWFRWVMRILPHDARLKEQIVQIQPNNYKVLVSGPTEVAALRADFRTHWKYGKRLYYAFKYVWWVLHAWDWMFADRLAPGLSFGFAVLTAFPDANPETTTVDGRVRELQSSGVSWATLVGGSGTAPADSASPEDIVRIRAKTTTNLWELLDRSIYLFDTASIGGGATIVNAVLSICGQNKTDPAGWGPDSDVYAVSPAANTSLSSSDFATFGSVSMTGAPKSYDDWSTSLYNDYDLDSNGIGNVKALGISKFGVRNSNYDVSGNSPTWSSGAESETIGYMADEAGITKDPKLVVVYKYNF